MNAAASLLVSLSLCATLIPSAAQAITLAEISQGAGPDQEVVYKKVGDQELHLGIFLPPGTKPSDKLPILFYIHGGGWTAGDQKVFYPHCRYAVARGAIGVSIDYRLMKPGGTTAIESYSDCKSALRWVRKHAAEFGGNPDQIVALGDSSGGHLAGCLGTIQGFDDPADDTSISAVPQAIVLYNPIVDCTDGTWWYAVNGPIPKHAPASQPSQQLLEKAKTLSPLFNIRPGEPPAQIQHGLADHVVNPDQARRFADAMKAAGNRCDLILIPDIGHAFVLIGYKKTPAAVHVKAMRDTDQFLSSLGILKGDPTLTE
jgi:acetyl esterase/lipase